MWPAVVVVPFRCWAPKEVTVGTGQRLRMIPDHLLKLDQAHQPILARHWGILRYLGYSSAPLKERWNSTVGKILKGKVGPQ